MELCSSVHHGVTFILSQGCLEKIIKNVHTVNAIMKRPLSDDRISTPESKHGQQSLVQTRYPPLKDICENTVTVSWIIAALQTQIGEGKPLEMKCAVFVPADFY